MPPRTLLLALHMRLTAFIFHMRKRLRPMISAAFVSSSTWLFHRGGGHGGS